ncbi:MAG TPA: hypothetical protein VLA60_02245, partial [Nitrospirales bacterium]|nr:hypothetical protein [Nitrospirales bacterium]
IGRLLGGPRDGRFLYCGPCLSAASWPAPHLASVLSNVAGLGVIGFGYFCRTKSSSAAGPKPGTF